MNTFRQTSHTAGKISIVFAFVAVLTIARAQFSPVAAENDAQGNATTHIQVCEAMGGTAEVTTYMTAGGEYTVMVECEGGYMDGFDCIHDKDFTECTQTRFEFYPDTEIAQPTGGIKPLDEPVATPIGGVVEEIEPIAPPIEDAPDGGDSTIPPTPEPEVDTGVDPVIEEPIVSDGDGGVAPEPTEEPGSDDSTPIDDVLVDTPEIGESISPGTDAPAPIDDQTPEGIDGIAIG